MLNHLNHSLLKVKTSSSGQFNLNYFNVMNHDHGLSLLQFISIKKIMKICVNNKCILKTTFLKFYFIDNISNPQLFRIKIINIVRCNMTV